MMKLVAGLTENGGIDEWMVLGDGCFEGEGRKLAASISRGTCTFPPRHKHSLSLFPDQRMHRCIVPSSSELSPIIQPSLSHRLACPGSHPA